MTKTENFALNQWDASDPIRREDFNADNAAIDAALGACAKIATGNYMGGGTYGADNPMTLTFDFKPRYIQIISASNGIGGHFYGLCAVEGLDGVIVYGNYMNSSFQSTTHLTWGEHSISWFSTESALYGMNQTDTGYYYIALG